MLSNLRDKILGTFILLVLLWGWGGVHIEAVFAAGVRETVGEAIGEVREKILEPVFEAFLKKDYQRARELLERLLARFPDHPDMVSYHALLQLMMLEQASPWEQLKTVDAIHHELDNVLTRHPDHFLAQAIKGILWLAVPSEYGGRREQGKALLTRAVTAYEGRDWQRQSPFQDVVYAYAHFYLGKQAGEAGEGEEAQFHYEKAAQASFLPERLSQPLERALATLSAAGEGFPIQAITFQELKGIEQDVIRRLLVLKEGEAFSRSGWEESMKALADTRLFQEVSIDKEVTEDEKVILHVSAKLYPTRYLWPYPLAIGDRNFRNWGEDLSARVYWVPRFDADVSSGYTEAVLSWQHPYRWLAPAISLQYASEPEVTKNQAQLVGSRYQRQMTQIGIDTILPTQFPLTLTGKFSHIEIGNLTAVGGDPYRLASGGRDTWEVALHQEGRVVSQTGELSSTTQLGWLRDQEDFFRIASDAFYRYPLGDRTSLKIDFSYQRLSGTPFHDQLYSLGGTEGLRGYSVYDWVAPEIASGGFSLHHDLLALWYGTTTLEGVLFVEQGWIEGESPSDYGIGFNVYTYPLRTLRFRLDLAWNDRGSARLTFSFLPH